MERLQIRKLSKNAIFIALLGLATTASAESLIWSSRASMLGVRGLVASAVVGDKIYSFGGDSSPGPRFIVNSDVYDTAGNTWTSLAPMPVATSGAKAVAVGSVIYVGGGSTAINFYTSAFRKYDTVGNAWSSLAPLPQILTGFGIHHYNDKIYVVGGWDLAGPKAFTREYDIATNTWVTKTPMPIAVSDFGSALIGTKIYAFGGRNGETTRTRTVQVYDIPNDTWGTVSDIPIEVGGQGVLMVAGRVFFVGRDGSWVYEPIGDSWTFVDGPKPPYQVWAIHEAVGNTIYVAGGDTNWPNFWFTDLMQRGEFATPTATATPSPSPTATPTPTVTYQVWSEATALASFGARRNFSMAVFKDRMWVIGGFQASILKNDVWNSSDGSQWTLVTPAAQFQAREGAALAALNEKLFLVGGAGNQSDIWSSIDGNTWTSVTTTAAFGPRNGARLVEFNGKLWLIGGHDGISSKSDVWSSADGTVWELVNATASFGPVSGHRVHVHQGRLWLTGNGQGSVANGTKTWSSADGSTWIQEPFSFPSRGSHGAASVGSLMFVYGGGNRDASFGARNDVYVSDGVSGWQRTSTFGVFSERSSFGAVSFRGAIWAVAGYGPDINLSDVWYSGSLHTYTATPAPTSTVTPTITLTMTHTVSPTFTLTATSTTTPTNTITSSATPTPTVTLSQTATPTSSPAYSPTAGIPDPGDIPYVYPQPFKCGDNVAVKLHRPGRVKVSMLSQRGNAQAKNEYTFGPGVNGAKFDCSGLGGGLKFMLVEIEYNDGEKVRLKPVRISVVE